MFQQDYSGGLEDCGINFAENLNVSSFEEDFLVQSQQLISAFESELTNDANESINTTISATEMDIDEDIESTEVEMDEAFDEIDSFFRDEFEELMKFSSEELSLLDGILEEAESTEVPPIAEFFQSFQPRQQNYTNLHDLNNVEILKEEFACITCHMTYTTSSSLFRHFKTPKHQRMENKLKSTADKKNYGFTLNDTKTAEVLSPNLVLVQTGDFSFHVDIAQQTFSQPKPSKSQTLKPKQRLRRQKPRPDPKTGLYQCQYCDKDFTTTSNLRRHENLHANAKTHQCIVCDKKFMQKEYLKKHMVTHQRFSV